MSMTIYPVTGAPLTLIKSDNTRAAGLVGAEQAGLPEGGPMSGGSVEIIQDRATTKNGSVRCMIKANLKTPYLVDTDGGQNMATISAHTVVTVPKAVADQLVFENTGSAQAQCSQAITWLLRVLAAAVYGNKSIAGTITTWSSTDIPVLQGLLGSMPLNLDTGTYGSAS